MRSGDERTLNPPIPHPQREVPKELAEEYAKESNILFMEVSAKTKENIDLIFETIGFPFVFLLICSSSLASNAQPRAVARCHAHRGSRPRRSEERLL